MRKLTLPMIGAADATEPPWDHLAALFHILPHLIAAAAISSASVLSYLEGDTAKVAIVVALLTVQVSMRAIADFQFRRRRSSDPLYIWLKRFTIVSLLSGTAWGVALAILYSGGSADTQVIVLAIGCGILQSSAARAYLAPRSTLLVIVIVTAFVNIAAIREGNWIMVPICIAYVGFLASYMVRLISLDEKRVAAEQKTRVLLEALADSNERLTQANEQLRRHARTDALTGLDNRRRLDEELTRRLVLMRETGRPLALLLIDVDHFKRFNDSHGHQAGDRCLQMVAEHLLAGIAERDAVAARYGGEEFAVLLQGLKPTEAIAFADKLRSGVAQLEVPTEEGRATSITVSIGVAVASPDDVEHTLVSRADRRLYQAKAAGRDRVSDRDALEPLSGSA